MCDVPYDLYGFYGGFKPVPAGMYLIYADLSAYARQPARGPTMLAHLVAVLAYLAGNVGPSCGYVGLMLIHVEPKDPKNGNSKKTL